MKKTPCFGMYNNNKKCYCDRFIADGEKNCIACKKETLKNVTINETRMREDEVPRLPISTELGRIKNNV